MGYKSRYFYPFSHICGQYLVFEASDKPKINIFVQL